MNGSIGVSGTYHGIASMLDTSRRAERRDRWGIILAGGDGSRLLPLTRKISGDDRPKQFCPILNGRTLLDQTRSRLTLSLSPSKTMFVLTQQHAHYYTDPLADVPRGNLVVQPRNAGTTPAIMYSLLCLERTDPDAAVAFFPSDHYFSDDRAFMSQVEVAYAAVDANPDSIVLLGIMPEGPDEEYGWIEPERENSLSTAHSLWRVRRFWEKPSPVLARNLMERGCLWNSFVMVGLIPTFLKIIRQTTTGLYSKFVSVRPQLSTATEQRAVEGLYARVRESNFSREVLQARPSDLTVFPVSGSKWSDLGSPRRVFSALSDLGGERPVKHNSARLISSGDGYYERARIRSSEVV